MNINIDGLRTVLGLLISQGTGMLVLLDIVSLDIEQLAAINGFAGTMIALFFLFVKSNTPSAPEATLLAKANNDD